MVAPLLFGGLFVVQKVFDFLLLPQNFSRTKAEGGNINMEVPKNMAGKEKRVKVTLVCTECKQRNYDTAKNKSNTPDRLEMNKYCRFCRKHTLHKESK